MEPILITNIATTVLFFFSTLLGGIKGTQAARVSLLCNFLNLQLGFWVNSQDSRNRFHCIFSWLERLLVAWWISSFPMQSNTKLCRIDKMPKCPGCWVGEPLLSWTSAMVCFCFLPSCWLHWVWSFPNASCRFNPGFFFKVCFSTVPCSRWMYHP